MNLHIPAPQFNLITAHAEQTYPEECCGLLIGTIAPDQTRATVVETWQVENAWSAESDAIRELYQSAHANQPSTKLERYWIDPRDLLNAQRYVRDHHLHLLGIYHSHPDHAAIPSECDRVLAWSHYSYWIVAVQHGMAQEVSSWRLDDHHQFQREEIIIL